MDHRGPSCPALRSSSRRPARDATRSSGRAASGAKPCDQVDATQRPPRSAAHDRTHAGGPARGSTTVSRASGGARTRRHEKASRPCREALPHRVRWSRTETAAGVTPRAGCMTADLVLDGVARPRLEERGQERLRRARVPLAWRMTSSSSNAPPIRSTDERRAQGRPARSGAGAGRRGTGTAPSRRPPRAASSARSRAWLRRWRRSHASRSARKSAMSGSGWAQPRRAGRRDGHDDAAGGVDDDPESTRTRRAAKRVRDGAAGQPRDRVRFGRDHERHPRLGPARAGSAMPQQPSRALARSRRHHGSRGVPFTTT